MKEKKEFIFDVENLMRLMLKDAKIHQGRWAFSVNVEISAGTFRGAADGKPRPAHMLAFNQLALVDATNAPDDTPLVFDAALLNPLPEKRKPAAKGKRKQ
ncbi:hypothetical protein [Vandammella animalimorsus]|uniref:hypothetical protein n=1 Tax=Vandammella animalimorsus TaxID=2029117 RepID=UPI00117826E1|nr:hypothetical protein [Vandammella animalimorsus]